MQPDNEGFFYPTIEEEICIDCAKCQKVCPALKLDAEKDCPPQLFMAWSKDSSVREKSSSGGLFFELAKQIIAQNGVVFGAAFDENLKLKHRAAHSLDDVKPLCRSKYLASDTNNAFAEVRNMLKMGKKVLFCGTPCQTNAIHSFLNGNRDNLLLVDFVCHGTPSQFLFDRCKTFFEEKNKCKLLEYHFRVKKKEQIHSIEKLYTQHNTTQHNTTQHNTIQHNTTQYNTIQHNTTQYNTIQHNKLYI
jgi:coenzyme F420-reducing hydrogenase beta subunit